MDIEARHRFFIRSSFYKRQDQFDLYENLPHKVVCQTHPFSPELLRNAGFPREAGVI
jgi:hypothetical protein